MSWSITSIEEFESIIPVKPPAVNRKINPRAHIIDNSNLIRPPCNVASQLKILMPVGIAIIIVAAVKYARVSTSRPTVNIWCAQTINPRKPIPIIAKIIPKDPNGSSLVV